MPIILFGLPGAGKTYTGKIFKESFGFHFYEGDQSLTSEMKKAIAAQSPITTTMRDNFFKKLVAAIKKLSMNRSNLVVAQTFIKEKYRKWVFDEICNTRFILVHTNVSIRERRLKLRTNYPLDLDYARKMYRNFDKPQIYHQVITNNEFGEDHIKRQVKSLIS